MASNLIVMRSAKYNTGLDPGQQELDLSQQICTLASRSRRGNRSSFFQPFERVLYATNEKPSFFCYFLYPLGPSFLPFVLCTQFLENCNLFYFPVQCFILQGLSFLNNSGAK